MATEDEFAHIWYADVNGNITGYVVNGGDKASTIIDAYNEHFGTDISIWTPEKNTLQVGDTLPNWNAYEKIELPPIVYAKINPQGSSLWTIGKILGDTFKILCQNEEGAWQVTNDGRINGVFGRPYDLMSYLWAPKLQQAGYETSTFEIEIVAYNVGDTIENWEEFIEL